MFKLKFHKQGLETEVKFHEEYGWDRFDVQRFIDIHDIGQYVLEYISDSKNFRSVYVKR